jgi:hypothetical protein
MQASEDVGKFASLSLETWLFEMKRKEERITRIFPKSEAHLCNNYKYGPYLRENTQDTHKKLSIS